MPKIITLSFLLAAFFSFSSCTHLEYAAEKQTSAEEVIEPEFSTELPADFKAKASAWKAQKKELIITEELRRYKVQAEAAFADKRFKDAIRHYEKASPLKRCGRMATLILPSFSQKKNATTKPYSI